jgi:ABC-type glycerol-3-phosphate transport system substrate-binding protein
VPIKFSKRQAIIIFGGLGLVIVVFVVIFLNLRKPANSGPAIKLTVWGTEDQQAFAPVAASYPYGTVTYKQVNAADYRSELLSALAAGTGPDVFEIGNRSLPKWLSVITPLPAAYAAEFGALQLSQDFPDVVAQDFVAPDASGTPSIYGLPLSVDTMVMIYNKDLFNTAGIAIPPATWDQFDSDVAKLRTLDTQGGIVQAAAAIGGTEASVPEAPDLLSLLMLQNGTQMTDAVHSSAQFAAASGNGPAAFNFYLQFANPTSPNYTWNDNMGNDIDSFVAGKTAVIFGYRSDLATIAEKAPFMNYGIAPMPQPAGATVAVNYPRYNGFVVAKASPQAAVAWNFVLYLTTTDAVEKMYVSATGAPPALRTEIAADANDPDLSVFAAQALTAKSWYEADDTQIDGIFNAAIANVLSGADDSTKALGQAEAAVTALMN